MDIVIIIPALNPDERLLRLTEKLRTLCDFPVIVVDDGSRRETQYIFDIITHLENCEVLHHVKNQGKGTALKTGIAHCMRAYPGCAGYVTADADLQHSPRDILRVTRALDNHPGSLILGTRNFSGANVPFKNRWGNRITSAVFRLSTGVRCPDTQTGLRGIPAGFTEACLSVPGERFEYEMNFLLTAARKKLSFEAVLIETIYLEGNRSTHFHPVRDSLLIYWNILKFGISSLLSSFVDLSLFTLFSSLLFGTGAKGLLAATVLARILSGCCNFFLNSNWVFTDRGLGGIKAVKYLALFCGQMLASWLMINLLSAMPVHLTLIKCMVDVGLFIISYRIQKRYIFRETITGGAW